MIVQIIFTIICLACTFLVIRWCAKITKQINNYKDLDWSNYKKNVQLLRDQQQDQQQVSEFLIRKTNDRLLDLGVQVEQIEKKMKQLEVHVFSVMKSSLYREAAKKDYLWYYFYSKHDMLNFIETNEIKNWEHRPPGCDLNDRKDHLLIIPNDSYS